MTWFSRAAPRAADREGSASPAKERGGSDRTKGVFREGSSPASAWGGEGEENANASARAAPL
jgi:hypothetical protein